MGGDHHDAFAAARALFWNECKCQCKPMKIVGTMNMETYGANKRMSGIATEL